MGKDKLNMCYFGDALKLAKRLPDGIINCIVTSPPYWKLRDYKCEGQLGQEETPEEYTENLVILFRELRRGLNDKGTLWLNIGDCYASTPTGSLGKRSTLEGGQANQAAGIKRKSKIVGNLKPKDLVGIPWRVAFALQKDGWYLRQDIIWYKPNAMPESVYDRCTNAHEYIFLFSKSKKYYYNYKAIKEKATSDHPAGNKHHKYADLYDLEKHKTQQHRTKAGLKKLCGIVWKKRNKRSVWEITTKPFRGAHYAVFPPDLIDPCILAGSKPGDIVLDPFFGSGTTGLVCEILGRKWLGFELDNKNEEIQKMRLEEKEKWIEKKLGKKKCKDPVELHIMQYFRDF